MSYEYRSGTAIWILICKNAVVRISRDSAANDHFAVMEEITDSIKEMFSGQLNWRKFGENTYGLFEGDRATEWSMQRVILP